MYFQQFYLGCLSHASYVIGSGGIAAVVDPQRDVGIYIEDAVKHGLRIEHVIETHLHADFISGHAELASLTGATIYLGAQAGAKFPHVPVRDGDEVRFGDCVLRFLETPGHTLESISILVTDTAQSPDPFAVLTGDTLFIGDVGRPDLAPNHTPQQLAGLLYDSLHTKLLTLPDAVQVYPAHGAGSLCGRQMSAERSSTIGQQRVANFALQAKSREDFVRLLTSELPERPGYFSLDAELNRTGPAPLADLPVPDGLLAKDIAPRQQAGALVLDTRPSGQFGGAHIPGAMHIALSGQFASWAGRLIGLDRRIILVAEDRDAMLDAFTRLARVGMEHVVGYLEDGMTAWFREGLPVDQVPQVTVQDLHREIEHVQVIDVRQPGEWEQMHIAQAVLKPLSKLTALLEGIDRERPIAVHCKSGFRSSIASSLLKREGFPQVMNVIGGIDAWKACDLPVVQNNIAWETEYSVDANVTPTFAWTYMTNVANWDDPPASFELHGPFAAGSLGTTHFPGQESRQWHLREVNPITSYISEMPLDRAAMSFEWRFEARPGGKARLTQRIVLSGENAPAYVEQVQAAFTASLAPGMNRIAAAMESSVG